MTREKLEKTVNDFMDSLTTVNLACSVEDRPWSAAVYFARQGFDLIFFSSPQSRHSTILSTNPRAAATIHGEYKGWREIKGLQMEGTVGRVAGALAKAKALATYLRRYPFAKEFIPDPRSFSDGPFGKAAEVALYVFAPESILYLNNEDGFGARWKLEIKDGKAVGEPVRG